MSKTAYYVARSQTVQYGPHDFINELKPVPAGALSDAELARLAGLGVLQTLEQQLAGPQPTVVAPVENLVSIWDRDPADLKGKTLAQLNVIVGEIDDTVAEFEDEREAIAQLTKDFKAKSVVKDPPKGVTQKSNKPKPERTEEDSQVATA